MARGNRDHGKKDMTKIAKDKGTAKMKQIAKARPGGEAARRLVERDVKNWKQG